MRKLIAYISVSCFTFLTSSFTGIPVADGHIIPGKSNFILRFPADPKHNISAKASLLYESLCLEEKGLSKEAFDYAYKGYEYLANKKMISQPGYLTICDLSQSVRQKRLYLIDISNNSVVLNTYVAHGRNSGGEYARRFSNKLKSLQSSLGFYVTKNTYAGEHGLSLRLEGIEPGFNDKAYRRAIVIHGASYIGDGLTGRSYGCPAVPKKESKLLINTIKNGTCFFVYNPEKKYLQTSRILND